MLITNELLTRGMIPNGAYTKKQLELVGISWPPQKGWKQRVIGQPISEADAELFVRLAGHKSPEPNLFKTV